MAPVCAALLGGATVDGAAAQEIRFGPERASPRSFRGWPRDMREGLQGESTGWSFCRLAYRSVTREPGGQGWTTDYPLAELNLMFRAEELTTIGMARHGDGQFAHSIVFATSPDLYRCPFLFASDVGTMSLTDEEVAHLKDYLDKGGFLWADDFWGDRAWSQWVSQIKRVLPGKEIVEITAEHPLFRTLYVVTEIPQIPSINHWRRSGGGTSERGNESEVPRMWAIHDESGRIMVLMSHNTDIADGWEREGEDQRYFYLFSPEAYAVATNVLVWMMTH
jgi:hypothetical protein